MIDDSNEKWTEIMSDACFQTQAPQLGNLCLNFLPLFLKEA